MAAVRWFLLGMLAVTTGLGLFLQREANANLRGEIALLRDEQRELARLRAEHARLVATQPDAAELVRLRADRAALERMWAETAALRERADAAQARLSRQK